MFAVGERAARLLGRERGRDIAKGGIMRERVTVRDRNKERER